MDLLIIPCIVAGFGLSFLLGYWAFRAKGMFVGPLVFCMIGLAYWRSTGIEFKTTPVAIAYRAFVDKIHPPPVLANTENLAKSVAPAQADPGPQVVVVGVHQAENAVKAADGPGKTGSVIVTLPADGPQVLLVLSNYEPVRWNIVDRGKKVTAVLVSSYLPAMVSGVNVPVTYIGTAAAYEDRGPDYLRLRELIAARVKASPRYFLGAYAAAQFNLPVQ